uniref:protein shisa-9 n=1 Tax=Halichoerus grypus TaxID=9711 RepID=UPI001659D8B1|nr:protein shisa-9 [Halichoerus grypus]
MGTHARERRSSKAAPASTAMFIWIYTTQMNNAVPTSPLLQQMGHPHSYPSLGQISNPYEQQLPGKELNKYASLKAVGSSDGDWAVATLKSPKADKVNDDFSSKRRHLAELAAKGNLPLHPVRVEDEPRAFSPEHGPAKQNGQKSRTNKMPPHPLAYNSTTNFKGWDPNEHSLRRQAYGNKGKLGAAESGSSDPLGTRTQHYPPPQPYFITNSKTEVTV